MYFYRLFYFENNIAKKKKKKNKKNQQVFPKHFKKLTLHFVLTQPDTSVFLFSLEYITIWQSVSVG